MRGLEPGLALEGALEGALGVNLGVNLGAARADDLSVASVAVVVCAFTERRWDDVCAAVEALGRQTRPADEVVLVIDHNDELLARATASLPEARVIASRNPRGLSGARNTGVWATTSDVVLFLDDDAVPADDWVEQMLRPFGDPRVTGVAGRVDARWDAPGRPAWFPETFAWTVGCSYRGLPTGEAEVRNPIGAAMGFRRTAFELVGGFSGAMGRVGDLPVGCEETEFAVRLRQVDPATRIVLAPAAGVAHRVPAARRELRYFVRRCYHEGRSKRAVARLVGSGDGLASERGHALRVLPAAFVAAIAHTLRTGRPAGLLEAAAVVGGLAATVAGYLTPAAAPAPMPAPAGTSAPRPGPIPAPIPPQGSAGDHAPGLRTAVDR